MLKLMRVLPEGITEARYLELRAQPGYWELAVTEIAERHGFSNAYLRPIQAGSSVVWSLGERFILKLMPPFWSQDCATEIKVLRTLQTTALAVPSVVVSAELEGWPYFIMDRLPGRYLSELWRELAHEQQHALMIQLAHTLKTMHQTTLTQLSELALDWPAFVRTQTEGFYARQQRYGIAESVITELDALLKSQTEALSDLKSGALMHCEMMPEHLLLSQTDSQWRITGLIDFGDPMIGAPEYEFGAVFIFMTAGRPDLRRSFLKAYGYTESDLTPETSRRFMGAALLHRFGAVPLGLKQLPAGESFESAFFSLS